ncbi:hypothetical protein [Rhodoferax sp.]|uniref:hypothetical protein n=1 Tax=Rhodoferax sp. TaxID=50421 RepID=UPI0025EB46E3|nr:hypothetical protein [Rhodoferax sp.]
MIDFYADGFLAQGVFMSLNFSFPNTASGKPERIAPGATHLQRRQVLKGALGGVATLGLGSLGLSASGGSDAATTVTATGLEFIGMPAIKQLLFCKFPKFSFGCW